MAEAVKQRVLRMADFLKNHPSGEFVSNENINSYVNDDLIRVILRLGLVDLHGSEHVTVQSGSGLSPEQKESIINAVANSVNILVQDSSLLAPLVVGSLRAAVKFCHKDKEPDCKQCHFFLICEKRTYLS